MITKSCSSCNRVIGTSSVFIPLYERALSVRSTLCREIVFAYRFKSISRFSLYSEALISPSSNQM